MIARSERVTLAHQFNRTGGVGREYGDILVWRGVEVIEYIASRSLNQLSGGF